MTAIWDLLGREASLIEEGKTTDTLRITKLWNVMRNIYLAISTRPEYQSLQLDYMMGDKALRLLLPTLKFLVMDVQVTKMVEPTTRGWGQMMHYCISALHDFDHEDLPVDGLKTRGHHTEEILSLPENRERALALDRIYMNSYWES